MMAGDGLAVSVSQLKEFMICPRRYQLHRVLGVEPAFVPVPLVLGSAAHAGFGAIYTSLQQGDEVLPLDEVLQVFRDAWSVAIDGPVPVKLEDEEADPVDAGVRMLAAFHRHVVTAGPVTVVAVELPFSGVELVDPDTGEVLEEHLVGVLDLLLSEGGGDVDGAERNVLVEHKTAGRRWTREQLDHDFQVTAYQVAARKIGLGEEVGLRFQIVTKTKVASIQVEDVVRDDLAEVDFLRTATGVLRAIGTGAFWPVRSWACKSCPYAHACSGSRR